MNLNVNGLNLPGTNSGVRDIGSTSLELDVESSPICVRLTSGMATGFVERL